MNTFFKHLLAFLLLPAIAFVLVEIYLFNYPSSFQLKAKYLESHKDQIEALAMGSSHNQMAIDPEFTPNTRLSNLAFAGQDLGLDYALMEKEIPKLKNLKVVVLEVSYHTLEHLNDEVERNSLYLWCYGIRKFDFSPDIRNVSIFLSQPELYKKYLNPFIEKPSINQYGFTTSLSKIDKATLRFKLMQFDTSRINSDTANLFIRRHRYEDHTAFEINKSVLIKMIALCQQRNLRVIIVSPPVYETYYKLMKPGKKIRRDHFIEEVIRQFPEIKFYNFENDPRFKVTDFMNEDHLNPDGARKFSLLFDSLIQ